MNFANYLQHIADALEEKKGLELAYLLSPREEHGKTILKEFRNPTVSLTLLFSAVQVWMNPTNVSNNPCHTTKAAWTRLGMKLQYNTCLWSTM